MASYAASAPRHGQQYQQQQQQQYAHPMQMGPAAPAGTFAPGTKIQVGSHRVVIQKYLSEGGFAHVYLVKMPHLVDGTDQAVLKRVAVPDKEHLREMRTEVETIKRLKGHNKIVTYIDSHASELKGGGYEVFLLMEFCNGGGLIDFMNTRLQHRLTEPEILNIFADVAEGVACMHYLKPPLLHRDLKVENVLIVTHNGRRVFKLCDFGSAAEPKPPPQSIVECRLLDEDVQKHTTMQYRSPEMVDVYRKLPIDEKSDIWALGVFLYKLCYYTTPFEDQGQLAILNASYKFPSHPVFSDRLKHLIASMLREDLRSRPNIYQVLRESCQMMGREVPVKDIYSGKTSSHSTNASQRQPVPKPGTSPPKMGAVYAPPPAQQAQAIPDIVPMRRGRPTSTQPAAQSVAQPPPSTHTKPTSSPMRVTDGDPFAALDSKAGKQTDDELSSRFPTLDEFSLLHDHGSKFDFDSPNSPPKSQRAPPRKPSVPVLGESSSQLQSTVVPNPSGQRPPVDHGRVKAAVGSVESHRPSPPLATTAQLSSLPPRPVSSMSRASAIISSNPELQAISSPPPQAGPSQPPRPAMVSTGTMTTPPLDRGPREFAPIHRFPPADNDRSSGLSAHQDTWNPTHSQQPDQSQSLRPTPGSRDAYPQQRPGHARHPSSSRPSLEGGRPSAELLEPLARKPSTSNRQRPASTYLESNLDYLREKEAAPRPLRSPAMPSSPRFTAKGSPSLDPQDDAAIESNVDFLRSMEDSDPKKDKAAKHAKRSSLTSLSDTTHKLAGKFGDAFKRFENNPGVARMPSPLKDPDGHGLTPIAGSEATDGRSDDGRPEEPEMTPEMRRELEAQSLAEEERRVEAAAAEYRRRVAAKEAGGAPVPPPKSIGGVSRAVSIQNRVQNLLDESQRSPVQKTASGYGKFSDAAATATAKEPPAVPRKPVTPGPPLPPKVPATLPRVRPGGGTQISVDKSAPPPRPSPAPKPSHLNQIPTGNRPRSPPKQPSRPPQQRQAVPEQLVAVELPGQPAIEMTAQQKED